MMEVNEDTQELIESEVIGISKTETEIQAVEDSKNENTVIDLVKRCCQEATNQLISEIVLEKGERCEEEKVEESIEIVRENERQTNILEETSVPDSVEKTGNGATEITDHVEPKNVAVFDFTKTPIQLTGSWTEFNDKDNFFKGCKWAPDGSCILTNNNDGLLRLWNLPDVFYNQNKNWNDIPEMTPILRIREGELIYDYCWYPLMSSLDYNSCCFASTSRNNPVHLFDAYTGELRCSYRAYNHVDEVESAYSVCFSACGQKLLCGFNKSVRIFDVGVPGRNFRENKTKKAQIQGQTGIISCIAVNPSMNEIYAAGSYLKTIALYAEADGSLICLLQGQQGGITHLMFSPDGNKIYSGGRMDPEILCWDLRNPGTVLFTLQRQVTTNQRIYFAADNSCRHIVSGNNNGVVNIWDTESVTNKSSTEISLDPLHSFQAHTDCVNGVSLHPTLPLMVTTSGQRKFPEPGHSDDSDSSSDEILTDKYINFDNSLRLWWLS